MSFFVLRRLRERWLGGLTRRGKRRTPAARPSRPGSTLRPQVEDLEDRTLLSVLPPPLVTQQSVISIDPPLGSIGAGGLHNTPSVAIDPANPQQMVAVYTTDLGAGLSVIQGSFSSDGGHTWQPLTGPSSGFQNAGSNPIPFIPNVISQYVTNPLTGNTALPMSTNPTVAFDHDVSVDASGNIVNTESFYVLYVEHTADNSAGAVMLEKFDFRTGFPRLSPLTPNLTITNAIDPSDTSWQQPGMLYAWAADSQQHSDPALNPVLMVDGNTAPVFPDPTNPARKVSFVDPATGATQVDNLIVPLIDDDPSTSGYGQPILDPSTNAPVYQGQIYVAWNTNNALPSPLPADFTPNTIRLQASSDGGQTFTTARFANQNDAGDPNFTVTGEADAAPRLVVSQGTSSDRASSPLVPIQSVTANGLVATATTAFPHGFTDGQSVAITGSTDKDYNGTYVIHVTSPTTFTYGLSAAPTTTSPGGTITARGIAVTGGQLNVVWNNFGSNPALGNGIQAQVIANGGTAGAFGDNNPQNQLGSGFLGGNNIIDAISAPNGGADIPGQSVFTQTVNIQNPAFNAATDLTISLNAFHANLDQLAIILLPEAQLSNARDLVINPADGNVYITSQTNSEVIEYDGQTGALIKQFVTSGKGGLDLPEGLLWGPDGDLYVTGLYTDRADGRSFGAVLRYDANGNPAPSAFGLSQDPANATSALFATDPLLQGATGLAFDSLGNLYVGSFNNNDIVEFQGPNGAAPGTRVGAGAFVIGNPATNGLSMPVGLDFGPDGALYVSSSGSNAVLRFDALGSPDPAPGQSGAIYANGGGLASPAYLTFGADGDLYVSSTGSNNILRYLGPNNITGPGTVPVPGTFLDVFAGFRNGVAVPRGLAFLPDSTGAPTPLGDLYILGKPGAASKVDQVIRVTGAPGVPNPAPGQTGATFVASGSGSLTLPNSILFRAGDNGNFLVTSAGNNTVQRYSGTNGLFLGTFISQQQGNSGGLTTPTGIAEDTSGNVYISSSGNSRILKYTGSNTANFQGVFVSPGPVDLSPTNPQGLVFFGGNLYVADFTNNEILRYDSNGAPNPSANFKNTAVFARGGLQGPTGIAIDPSTGNLYVSSSLNNKVIVFDPQGNLLGTVANSTTSPLLGPQGILIPGDGTFFVSSQGNNRILRYRLGTGQYLESLVPYANNPANTGGLNGPAGIAVDPFDGNLVVASSKNNSVMRYTGSPAQDDGTSFGGIFVQPGGGSQSITLLRNHTNPDGSTNTGVGISTGANLGIWTHPNTPFPPQYVGLTFDQDAARRINDPTATAPFSQQFRPEGTGYAFGSTIGLNFVLGQTAAALNGDWSLEIIDNRTNTTNGIPPVQSLQDWTISITSGLSAYPVDRTVPSLTSDSTGLIQTPSPAPGSASEDGSTIFNNGFTSTTKFPNTTATPADPNRGIGPTPVIAADATLGSFSPYEGRLYVAYVGGSGDSTDIYLSTSDDGGLTWLKQPVKVNDDSINDNFSEGSRPQFDPSIAVDPTTGTLVVSFLDTRNDAARVRSATYLAVSNDGGYRVDPVSGLVVPDFSPETYLNDSLTATDAITFQKDVLQPIPDNPNVDTQFNYGDYQGLAVYHGQVITAWAGDKNQAGAMNIYTALHSLADGTLAGGAAITDGPRVLTSTEGPVTSGVAMTDDGRTFYYNNTYAVDGTQQVDGFVVTFDRPVAADPLTDAPAGGSDPNAFGPDDVQVVYRDTTTPAGTPGLPVTVSQVIPLDGYTTRYGPALVGGVNPTNGEPLLSTKFLVLFAPQSGVGTYSYAIGPDVGDRVRTRVPSVGPGTPLLPENSTDTPLRVPPVDSGGDALNGAPQNDVTFSTITYAGVPDTQRVTDVSVTVNIRHTFDADLVISLIAPDGTQVVLSQNEGGSGQNFLGTTFSDHATTPISQGSAPFSGTFRPDEPLASFLGKVVDGGWTLAVDDTQQADTGILLGWTLNISTGPATTTLQTGNLMDQSGNGLTAEAASATAANDVYAVPTPVNGGPIFKPAYVGTSLPLLVPGPHIVSTFVPGQDNHGNVINPQSSDNLVLNQAVKFIDVTFDRDMDPNSFVAGTAGATPLFQLLGPNGAIPLFGANGLPLPGVTISPDPNPMYPRLIDGQVTSDRDPDLTHPRTFRITLPDLPGAPAGSGLNLDGTYSLTLAPTTATATPGPTSAAGDLIDTNLNAGLDLLRGVASDPLHASFTNVAHAYTGGDVTVHAGKGPVDVPLTFGPEDFLIQKATVQVNISVPNDPDLQAELISPDGKTVVPLFTGVGNNGTHRDFLNTVFDDTATTPIQNGVAPFNSVQFGPFQPQTPLAQLNDLPAAGVWTLRLQDNGLAGRDAVLHSWSLTLSEAIPGTGLGEPTADDATIHFRVFTQDPLNPLSHTVWTPIGPAAITTAVTPQTANATNSVPVTHGYTGAPLDVGPGQTISVPVDFRPDNFAIQKAVATLNITDPNDSELTAVLVGPDGTQIKLFDQLPNTNGADFANTVFDDLGLSGIGSTGSGFAHAPFYSPLQGSFVPTEPLSAFLNKSSYGTWTLQLTNHSATNTATLSSWSLTLSKPIPSNSGQVNAIAVDPSDPSGNTVYLGAQSGGIWRTTNFLTSDPNGPTWTPLTDFGPTGAEDISSIAVFGRNNDPRQSIIFATTGDGGTGTPGVGILRSEDGGATWTLLDSTNNSDSNVVASGNLTPINTPFNAATGTGRDHAFVGLTSYKILVDPTPAPTSPNDVIVYAAFGGGANGGLWRSLDSGRHWQLMTADFGQPATGTEATDIAFAPATVSVSTGNLQDLYVAFASSSTGAGGVYVSTNQGSNMRLMGGGVGNTLIRDGDTSPASPIAVNNDAQNPNGGGGRIVLAVPPLAHNHVDPTTHKPDLVLNSQDPDNLLYEQWVYAAVVNTNGTLNGLYVTKDTGANWTKVSLPALLVQQPAPFPPVQTGIATNDETQPQHDVTGPNNFPLPGGNGNNTISVLVDPADPNVVYLGGLDNIGILKTPKPTGGLIRVNTTPMHDPHSYTAFDNEDPDGGILQPLTDGSLVLKQPPFGNGNTFKILQQLPDGSGNVKVITPATNTPYVNLVTDPSNPFLRFEGNATVLSSGVAAFSNTGDDARYATFLQAVNGPNGFEENGNLGIQTMVSITDPLTGLPRLLFGATTGVFSAVDNNGQLVQSIGNTGDPTQPGGDVALPTTSRNGNLQIAQLFSGTAQPSVPAAEVAAGIRGSGGMFYGNANNNGFPVSDPLTLDNGNLLWSGPLGSGSGVATDQTGTGNAYSFQWPGFGQYSALATTNFFVVNPKGTGYISRTGTGGTSLVQVNGGALQPDPQWPFMSVNPTIAISQFGGATTPLNLPNSNFAVNPLNGDQIVISSEAGRIFRTRDQGRDWSVIADPATLGNGGYAPALAYGAPDPADPSHQVDDFIWVGTSAGTLWATLDGGSHWQNLTAALPGGTIDGSPVLTLSTDPVRGHHDAYVVTEKGVYYVTFNVTYPFNTKPNVTGITWSTLTGNLFNIKSSFAGFNNQPDALSSPNALNATNGLLFQMPHDNSAANAATFAPEESTLQYLTSLAVDWREVTGPNAKPGGPTLYVAGAGGVFRSVNADPANPTVANWTVFPAVADGSQVTGGFLPMAEVTNLTLSTGGVNPANGLPNQSTGPNVLVATTYGRGEFAIRLQNNDPFNLVHGPAITGLSPNPAPSGTSAITVTFDGTVDPTTFTTDDIVSFTDPNGKPVVPLSVTDVSTPPAAGQPSPHNKFQITFAPVSTVGNYTIIIGPNITDFAGHQMDQNFNNIDGETGLAPAGDEFVGTFTVQPVDANGLHVIGSAADSLVVPPGMSSITVQFNIGVNPATFQPADVSLVGPGAKAVTGVSVTDTNPGTDTVFQIAFPTQTTLGAYTLTLSNTIQDQNGHFIDQNENDPNATTNTREPADQYTATFTLTQAPSNGGNGSNGGSNTTPTAPGIQTQVAFVAGKIKKLRNGLYRQNVTVFNVGSQPIPQPLALLVGGLGRKIRLRNAFGTTRSIKPGTPYVLGSASNAQLNSFQGATFTLLYKNPQNRKIKPLFELVAGIFAP